MATLSLSSAGVAANDSFYVDTSGLMALAHLAASQDGKPAPPIEVRRGAILNAFLGRVASAGGAARTSVLAYEEVAASTRNRLRALEATAAGYPSWKAFKQQDPAGAAQKDAKPHQAMLEIMQFAAAAAGKAGIAVDWPLPGAAAPSTLRRRHRDLLRKHPEVDAMDALHIVVGLALGIRCFVTFDRGWDAVGGIDVLG